MIAKKIRNPRKSASKYVRIQRLVDYVRKPKGKDDQEKNVYEGARNFFAEDKRGQVKEMQDLAHAAVRSKDPINHYVISWKSRELPTPKQIERTVDVVLSELKMKDHQVIYAVHADTKHHHLHLVVNRVHPETEKAVLPNRGFDIELLHRAVARLEHEQGWKKEARARYQVQENGEVRRNRYEEKEKQPSQNKRDKEHRTGAKSAERVAQERAPEVMRKATTWQELHQNLAQEGMRFEKKGSGAVLNVGKVPVKASSVGRENSLGSLQKRLGAFEPSTSHLEVHQRSPESLVPKAYDWMRYLSEKATYEENKKSAVGSLREHHAQEKRELAFNKREAQTQLLSEDWKGRGRELNEARSHLAGESKAALAQLKATQVSERRELKKKWPPFPSLEAWRAKQRQQTQPQPNQTQQQSHEQKPEALQQEQTKQREEQERVAAQQPVRRKQPDIER